MKKLIIFLLIVAPFVLNAQMTYVPDDNFEQALINLGYDTPPRNDSVPTKNIDTVTVLNVNNIDIQDLTGIEDFKALVYLNCTSNNLKTLDIRKNLALVSLICQYNELTNIDVSKNIALEMLNCNTNNLTSLDISNNSALKVLDCSFNDINNLDVTKNSALDILYCKGNELNSLDVSKNPSLGMLLCRLNKLTNLDVSKCTNLKELDCSNNLLSILNLKNGNNKNMINSHGNCFDATGNPNLSCIQVDDSAFSSKSECWDEDFLVYYSTDCGYTGVEDFKFDNKDVSVAPNPATDFIELNLNNRGINSSVGDDVKIYNFLGEIVSGLDTPPYPLFLEGGKMRLDVSGLAAGVYFVRLGDSVQRFVKY